MLRRLAPTDHPDLLVGALTGDDAAVWRLTDERALVLTADFITPVVDDAATWGRIAAANAVSDVYAMGATPLLALNLVGWPVDALATDLLGEVLAGGHALASAAGFVVAGGHTIDDPEPKYGMAVVGEVHPATLLTNAGLRPGDVLVLTKPLGVGVVTTALKRSPEAVEPATAGPSTRLLDDSPCDLTVSAAAAIASMTRLNAAAAHAARTAGATGATDVTGFGLFGHLGRMAIESNVAVDLDVAAVPLLPGARALAAAGTVPGGSERNLAWARGIVDPGVHDELTLLLLADAQTSGGLVFGAADEASAAAAVAHLATDGHEAAVIGTVRRADATGDSARIRVR